MDLSRQAAAFEVVCSDHLGQHSLQLVGIAQSIFEVVRTQVCGQAHWLRQAVNCRLKAAWFRLVK